MKTLTIKKARQLIRKNRPNTEKMFEAMKGWPFRVRLSLAGQLLIGWKKGRRRGDDKKREATDSPGSGVRRTSAEGTPPLT